MSNGTLSFDWSGIPTWAKVIAMIGIPSTFALVLLVFVLQTEAQKIQTLTDALTAASKQSHDDAVDSNKVLENYIKTNEQANRESSRNGALLNKMVAVAQQQCILAAKGDDAKIARCIAASVPLSAQDIPAY